MRQALAGFLIVILMACQGQPSAQTRIMDAIEANVELPDRAHELGNYARYYAEGPDDDIVAVYVLPDLLSERAKESCGKLSADLRSSPVRCLSLVREDAPIIGAGDRYWLKDWHNLPWISDPKCGDVTVVYEQARNRFKEVRCPGATAVE